MLDFLYETATFVLGLFQGLSRFLPSTYIHSNTLYVASHCVKVKHV